MERKQSPTCTLHDNRRKEKVGGRVLHLLHVHFSIGSKSVREDPDNEADVAPD